MSEAAARHPSRELTALADADANPRPSATHDVIKPANDEKRSR